MKIRIGTRKSPLAMVQAEKVAHILKKNEVEVEFVTYETIGDKNTAQPLYDIGGKALFVKELQHDLLSSRIDIAVHSLKDCESTHPVGLTLGAVLARDAVEDLLVHHIGLNFDETFVLGTSSPRRMALAYDYFDTVEFVNLRGNVQTRLKKLQDRVCDATILAKAGLSRLGLIDEKNHFTSDEYKDLNIKLLPFTPAACQGIIGIECRENDVELRTILNQINHPETFKISEIERHVIACFEGNCRTSIAVQAEPLKKDKFYLNIVYLHDKLNILKKDFCTLDTNADWRSFILAIVDKLKADHP
jgi:hydroxymethylbilane synthase